MSCAAEPLRGRHIVLGVTGGIAAYKTAVLTRLLVKAGAEVQVIMTPNAREFITPLTLATLSGRGVITEFFTANTGEWHSHVSLGLWADAMVIAPATASSIGKMVYGIADNMLITSYLSCRAKVFAAPAMDLDMMAHPSTVENLAKLAERGVAIIEPAEGELASHLVGKGRMAEPEEIVAQLRAYFASQGDLCGKRVMITAGPTYERIDPVRFIGNFSSGKMGFALAREAARRGASVALICGPASGIPDEPGIEVKRVESAREMLIEAQAAWPEADIAILAAAVADYRPTVCADRKIKREADSVEAIQLTQNPDIAATLGASKRPGQTLVGFALETDNGSANAAAKLRRKNLDLIVLNSLSDEGAGFGVDTNKITIIAADGRQPIDVPLKSKADAAADIFDSIKAL